MITLIISLLISLSSATSDGTATTQKGNSTTTPTTGVNGGTSTWADERK